MMKAQILTPKSFIKEPHERQKYECLICYEVCIKPVRCRGPCGGIFCMKCVSDTRNNSNNNDRCPNRCSSPFLVDILPELQLQFFCPYNPSACHQEISSISTFENHYKTCQYVPSETVHYKSLQNDYKCYKGHHLQFYVGSYEEMIKLLCVECGEEKLCRSFCRICGEYYCVQCRRLPCSKEGCPIGHEFRFQRIGVVNFLCDLCGISTAVSNGGVYDDDLCNFGLCELCFKELPEKYDQSKPRAIVANINTQCSSCNSSLTLSTTNEAIQCCELCKKQKVCPKRCQNCEKKYCIDCKLMDIYSDLTCLEDHQFVKTSRNRPHNYNPGSISCMKCSKPQLSEYYIDPHCKIILCEPCLLYSMRVRTDKQRPLMLTCDKNHILCYLPEDYTDVCFKCQKQKCMKLLCPHCEAGQQLYCYQCRSIPLETCYYKHKLKELEVGQAKQCHVCGRSGKKFRYCGKCEFYACLECVGLTMNGAVKGEVEEYGRSERDESGELMEVEEDREVGEVGEIEAEEDSIVPEM